jgi:cytochrome c peroxidase
MKTLIALWAALAGTAAFAAASAPAIVVDPDGSALTLAAGHPSLAKWTLPKAMPAPADNPTTPQRVALGEKLFFDARLSIHGRTSCSSCHLPERGWADGVPRSLRFMGQPTPRNSQSVVNAGFSETAYNWDGKNKSLEQQATGSQGFTGATGGGAKEIGIADPDLGIARIKGIAGYQALFATAYPGEPITQARQGHCRVRAHADLPQHPVRPLGGRRCHRNDAQPGERPARLPGPRQGQLRRLPCSAVLQRQGLPQRGPQAVWRA